MFSGHEGGCKGDGELESFISRLNTVERYLFGGFRLRFSRTRGDWSYAPFGMLLCGSSSVIFDISSLSGSRLTEASLSSFTCLVCVPIGLAFGALSAFAVG